MILLMMIIIPAFLLETTLSQCVVSKIANALLTQLLI